MKHFATPDFWKAYESLPAHVRRLADRNYQLLKTDSRHPSLHFKRVGCFWAAWPRAGRLEAHEDHGSRRQRNPDSRCRWSVLSHLYDEVRGCCLRVSRTTLSRIINGRASISADLAIRLERAGVSAARFWMMLQSNYELAQAEQRIQPDVQPLQSAACRGLLARCGLGMAVVRDEMAWFG